MLDKDIPDKGYICCLENVYLHLCSFLSLHHPDSLQVPVPRPQGQEGQEKEEVSVELEGPRREQGGQEEAQGGRERKEARGEGASSGGT